MKKEKIYSDNAPQAIGPYSQAIKVGDFIFCSGQIGLDPKTNNLVKGGIEKETKQILNNLFEILKATDADLNNVVSVSIFLTNINDFSKVNKIYFKHFISEPNPARQAIAVTALPKKAKIEISCIAYKKI